jgi:hypothetical protein
MRTCLLILAAGCHQGVAQPGKDGPATGVTTTQPDPTTPASTTTSIDTQDPATGSDTGAPHTPTDTGGPTSTTPPIDTATAPVDAFDGTYVGPIEVDCASSGVGLPIADTCAGDLTVTVDAAGTPRLVGSGTCNFGGPLSLLGAQAITVEGDLVKAPAAEGQVDLAAGTAQWAGGFADDDGSAYQTLTGAFAGAITVDLPGPGTTDFDCTGAFDLGRS